MNTRILPFPYSPVPDNPVNPAPTPIPEPEPDEDDEDDDW